MFKQGTEIEIYKVTHAERNIIPAIHLVVASLTVDIQLLGKEVPLLARIDKWDRESEETNYKSYLQAFYRVLTALYKSQRKQEKETARCGERKLVSF